MRKYLLPIIILFVAVVFLVRFTTVMENYWYRTNLPMT